MGISFNIDALEHSKADVKNSSHNDVETHLLLQQGKMGNLTLRNRVVMAPMNVGALNNSDGCLSERGIEYFTERARGGTGLIITGAVRVTREFERSKDTIPLWMAFADHKIHTGWINELAERCHDHGAKLAIQLTLGGGRQAGPFVQEHGLAIAPSKIKCRIPPYKFCRELTKNDMNVFLKAFQESASIIKTAGADAIELHGHEGYLMDQFTTSLWNFRTDEYGGTLENRLRFIKEIIESIKRGAGEEFPIIYRYGLSHFVDGGRSIEEGLEMAILLENYGVAALDIDAGCYETWYLAHPPTTMPSGFLASLVARVKSVVSIPVIISGKINYPEVAEDILTRNQADFVAIGRPLIVDPEWANKVKENRIDEIMPCIGCHEGCLRRIVDFKSISCAVNPAAGNEKYLSVTRANVTKRVIIVGGGVAGMVSAIVAATRGHSVLLIEQSDTLGGNFQERYLPKFKYDYHMYIRYLVNKLTKLGVNVMTGHVFSESDYTVYKPNLVVIATGATFKETNIKGIKESNCLKPLECFTSRQFEGKYAVIGGGLIGVEAAINMAQNGGEVYLIESDTLIAKDSFRANREHLLLLLNKYKISIHVNTNVVAIDNTIVNCEVSDGVKWSLKVDKIVVCVGLEANPLSFDYLNSKETDILFVGDCVKPGKVIDAVWDAYRKLRLI